MLHFHIMIRVIRDARRDYSPISSPNGFDRFSLNAEIILKKCFIGKPHLLSAPLVYPGRLASLGSQN